MIVPPITHRVEVGICGSPVGMPCVLHSGGKRLGAAQK